MMSIRTVHVVKHGEDPGFCAIPNPDGIMQDIEDIAGENG